MSTWRRRYRGQQQPKGDKDGGIGREHGERGAAAPLELVILAPLLMLLVVFVLWAGRGGRAVLVADLAAEEAAVVASLCCEDGPSGQAEREAVVEQVLAARPGLDFLCIGGVRPASLENDGFVDEKWHREFEPEVAGRARGVGVIGVRLACETDGAVAPLRGIFPTVSFYGQAAEVVAIPPRLLIRVSSPDPQMEGDPGDANTLDFEIMFSAPSTQEVTITCQKTGGTADGADHGSCPGPVTIAEGGYTHTISIPIVGDNVNESEETLELEFELVLSAPCNPRAPALVDPVADNARIQCDDPTAQTYEKPVDPDSGTLEPDYWKATATGIILNDDP